MKQRRHRKQRRQRNNTTGVRAFSSASYASWGRAFRPDIKNAGRSRHRTAVGRRAAPPFGGTCAWPIQQGSHKGRGAATIRSS